MSTFLYIGIVLLLAAFAYNLYQHNNHKLAFLVIAIGVYIVYSQETGHTATEFKNELLQSVEEEVDDVANTYKFDEEKIGKTVN